ncbi:MAG: hypothetical protein ACRBF0_15195 [Calditrichia bacterium]
MPVDDGKKTILICSANPKDMRRDRLEDEQRLIESTLRRDKQRKKYKIVFSTATTIKTLRRALIDHEPSILHFCGTADRSGVYVEDGNGNAKAVDPHHLLNLLDLFKDSLELVFLSGCYHPQLMENIKTQISDVVGILPHPDLHRTDLDDLVAPFYEAMLAERHGPVWAVDFARRAQNLDAEKQHLAKLLVHHSEDIPSDIEVPAFPSAKPELQVPQNPGWVESLLPFLCDCSNMEMAFRRALRHYLSEPVRGPLITFFLGDENDCLHKLLERFHYHPLQKTSVAFQDYPEWDFLSVGSEWPTSLNNFDMELSNRLAYSLDLNADDEEGLKIEWPSRPLPQVLPIRYDLNSWKGNRGSGLQAFINFWKLLSGENFGQPMIIFFQIEFNQQSGLWRNISSNDLKRVRRFIENQIKYAPPDVNILLLPPTEKIRSKHIQSWKDHELVKSFLGDKRFQLDLSTILSSMKSCNNMKLASKELKNVLAKLQNDYRDSA